MKLFIDSADSDEIKDVLSYGILEGVTTNPSLIKKAVDKRKKAGEEIDLESYLKTLLKTCKGIPVSLEVIGTSFEEMLSEGETLYKKFNGVAKNVVVKVPVDPCMETICTHASDGIKTIKALTKAGIPVNCTLIFTPEQALLAAKAGATYVSPFTGRVDDYIREMNRIEFQKTDYFPEDGIKKGQKTLADNGIVSGVDLVEETKRIFLKNNIRSQVLAASIRNVRQFRECAEVGADIATVPYKVIQTLLAHHKTAEGMQNFVKDVVPEYAEIVRRKKK